MINYQHLTDHSIQVEGELIFSEEFVSFLIAHVHDLIKIIEVVIPDTINYHWRDIKDLKTSTHFTSHAKLYFKIIYSKGRES